MIKYNNDNNNDLLHAAETFLRS